MSSKLRKPKAPEVDDKTAFKLWVAAGGRCSFPGCNDYLLRDNLTQWDIKQGHIGHIIARSKDGPRGDDPLPLSERSEIGNLILVCRNHHHVIDSQDYVEEFPKERLLQYKKQHEERIHELTACSPDMRSRVIRVRARINGETVNVPYPHICQALFQQELFPRERDVIDIDLTQHLDGETQTFLQYGQEVIHSALANAYRRNVRGEDADHFSVFAIGPIPLLVYLGSQLSNKIPTLLFQRHRDPEDWRWEDGDGECHYETVLVQQGSDYGNVALILSLSGKTTVDQLPRAIDGSFFIYEITLRDATPSLQLLRTIGDLNRFQAVYHSFLAQMREDHARAEAIHLFPAVPAPVAVVCGRELLHKVSPSLLVYDRDKHKGGFKFVLEVD